MPEQSNATPDIGGSWTHSHEEDHDDVLVFRPASRDFPPARGRESFTLAPGGQLQQSGPGPDDRTVETLGTWSCEGNRLILEPYGAQPRHYLVEEVGEDHLLLRPDA